MEITRPVEQVNKFQVENKSPVSKVHNQLQTEKQDYTEDKVNDLKYFDSSKIKQTDNVEKKQYNIAMSRSAEQQNEMEIYKEEKKSDYQWQQQSADHIWKTKGQRHSYMDKNTLTRLSNKLGEQALSMAQQASEESKNTGKQTDEFEEQLHRLIKICKDLQYNRSYGAKSIESTQNVNQQKTMIIASLNDEIKAIEMQNEEKEQNQNEQERIEFTSNDINQWQKLYQILKNCIDYKQWKKIKQIIDDIPNISDDAQVFKSQHKLNKLQDIDYLIDQISQKNNQTSQSVHRINELKNNINALHKIFRLTTDNVMNIVEVIEEGESNIQSKNKNNNSCKDRTQSFISLQSQQMILRQILHILMCKLVDEFQLMETPIKTEKMQDIQYQTNISQFTNQNENNNDLQNVIDNRIQNENQSQQTQQEDQINILLSNYQQQRNSYQNSNNDNAIDQQQQQIYQSNKNAYTSTFLNLNERQHQPNQGIQLNQENLVEQQNQQNIGQNFNDEQLKETNSALVNVQQYCKSDLQIVSDMACYNEHHLLDQSIDMHLSYQGSDYVMQLDQPELHQQSELHKQHEQSEQLDQPEQSEQPQLSLQQEQPQKYEEIEQYEQREQHFNGGKTEQMIEFEEQYLKQALQTNPLWFDARCKHYNIRETYHLHKYMIRVRYFCILNLLLISLKNQHCMFIGMQSQKYLSIYLQLYSLNRKNKQQNSFPFQIDQASQDCQCDCQPMNHLSDGLPNEPLPLSNGQQTQQESCRLTGLGRYGGKKFNHHIFNQSPISHLSHFNQKNNTNQVSRSRLGDSPDLECQEILDVYQPNGDSVDSVEVSHGEQGEDEIDQSQYQDYQDPCIKMDQSIGTEKVEGASQNYNHQIFQYMNINQFIDNYASFRYLVKPLFQIEKTIEHNNLLNLQNSIKSKQLLRSQVKYFQQITKHKGAKYMSCSHEAIVTKSKELKDEDMEPQLRQQCLQVKDQDDLYTEKVNSMKAQILNNMLQKHDLRLDPRKKVLGQQIDNQFDNVKLAHTTREIRRLNKDQIHQVQMQNYNLMKEINWIDKCKKRMQDEYDLQRHDRVQREYEQEKTLMQQAQSNSIQLEEGEVFVGIHDDSQCLEAKTVNDKCMQIKHFTNISDHHKEGTFNYQQINLDNETVTVTFEQEKTEENKIYSSQQYKMQENQTDTLEYQKQELNQNDSLEQDIQLKSQLHYNLVQQDKIKEDYREMNDQNGNKRCQQNEQNFNLMINLVQKLQNHEYASILNQPLQTNSDYFDRCSQNWMTLSMIECMLHEGTYLESNEVIRDINKMIQIKIDILSNMRETNANTSLPPNDEAADLKKVNLFKKYFVNQALSFCNRSLYHYQNTQPLNENKKDQSFNLNDSKKTNNKNQNQCFNNLNVSESSSNNKKNQTNHSIKKDYNQVQQFKSMNTQQKLYFNQIQNNTQQINEMIVQQSYQNQSTILKKDSKDQCQKDIKMLTKDQNQILLQKRQSSKLSHDDDDLPKQNFKRVKLDDKIDNTFHIQHPILPQINEVGSQNLNIAKIEAKYLTDTQFQNPFKIQQAVPSQQIPKQSLEFSNSYIDVDEKMLNQQKIGDQLVIQPHLIEERQNKDTGDDAAVKTSNDELTVSQKKFIQDVIINVSKMGPKESQKFYNKIKEMLLQGSRQSYLNTSGNQEITQLSIESIQEMIDGRLIDIEDLHKDHLDNIIDYFVFKGNFYKLTQLEINQSKSPSKTGIFKNDVNFLVNLLERITIFMNKFKFSNQLQKDIIMGTLYQWDYDKCIHHDLDQNVTSECKEYKKQNLFELLKRYLQ